LKKELGEGGGGAGWGEGEQIFTILLGHPQTSVTEFSTRKYTQ